MGVFSPFLSFLRRLKWFPVGCFPNLQNPLFCQDTVHTLSLASRACQKSNYGVTNSKMKTKNSAIPQVLSSQRFVKPASTPAAEKNQVVSSVQLPAKKGSAMLKGR